MELGYIGLFICAIVCVPTRLYDGIVQCWWRLAVAFTIYIMNPYISLQFSCVWYVVILRLWMWMIPFVAILVQHVFPEFNNPIGHIISDPRKYDHIKYSDPNNFRKALQSLVAGIRDPELPMRVDSIFGLRSFVESCTCKAHQLRVLMPYAAIHL